MTLKRTLKFTSLILMFTLSFVAHAVQTTVIKNAQALQELFNIDKETLQYQQVVPLANKVIKARQDYSNNTIALAFVLLADVAINQGDLDRAFQFAQDSSKLNITDKLIKFRIIQQLMLSHITQGKYRLFLTAAQQAFTLTQDIDGISSSLIALSYRSVAYALLGKHQKSLADLQIVEKHISENIKFSNHIELLEILALANSYLGNYDTVLTIHLDILKLRFNLGKRNNIEQTYYQLGEAYRHLNQLDDAYNAYNEAKQFSISKGAKIHQAYAAKGLGFILLLQQEYTLARNELRQAKLLFEGRNLNKPYLETLILLSKINLLLNDHNAAYLLLEKAELMISNDKLSQENAVIYSLLAEMYFNKQSFKQAFYWQKKHALTLTVEQNKKYDFSSTSYINKQFQPSNSTYISQENVLAANKAKHLTIKLAEKSELITYYNDKFQLQQNTINALVISLLILTLVLISYWLQQRKKQLNFDYSHTEKSQYHLATPLQTKDFYQSTFKKARTYEYPLTIGYFSVENWQELSFHFNRKTMSEVNKTIATLINEYLGEFDFAGLLNNGQYLLLFPHQQQKEVEMKMAQFKQAFNIRFFANLGDYSVDSKFVCSTPTFLDIDPYVFLSQLLNNDDVIDE